MRRVGRLLWKGIVLPDSLVDGALFQWRLLCSLALLHYFVFMFVIPHVCQRCALAVFVIHRHHRWGHRCGWCGCGIPPGAGSGVSWPIPSAIASRHPSFISVGVHLQLVRFWITPGAGAGVSWPIPPAIVVFSASCCHFVSWCTLGFGPRDRDIGSDRRPAPLPLFGCARLAAGE